MSPMMATAIQRSNTIYLSFTHHLPITDQGQSLVGDRLSSTSEWLCQPALAQLLQPPHNGLWGQPRVGLFADVGLGHSDLWLGSKDTKDLPLVGVQCRYRFG